MAQEHHFLVPLTQLELYGELHSILCLWIQCEAGLQSIPHHLFPHFSAFTASPIFLNSSCWKPVLSFLHEYKSLYQVLLKDFRQRLIFVDLIHVSVPFKIFGQHTIVFAIQHGDSCLRNCRNFSSMQQHNTHCSLYLFTSLHIKQKEPKKV